MHMCIEAIQFKDINKIITTVKELSKMFTSVGLGLFKSIQSDQRKTLGMKFFNMSLASNTA